MKESGRLKILSWNLLHSKGAVAYDICQLVEKHEPDLVLMQEVTSDIDGLEQTLGGHYHRHPWVGRKHGLACWSSISVPLSVPLSLPHSRIPGSFPPRIAQLIEVGSITIANVHLSHGQVLNRRQLSRISASTFGSTAIIGDYNAVGPIALKGFQDVGPRGTTHRAQKVVPFRLDRCMIRELRCLDATKLAKGSSDHRPILVELEQPLGA